MSPRFETLLLLQALPPSASLTVFSHWFGSDETRIITIPTPPWKWSCSEGLSGTSLTDSLKAWHTDRKRETWGNTITSVCPSMRDSTLYLRCCSLWGQLWTQDFMHRTHSLSIHQGYTLLLQLCCRQNTAFPELTYIIVLSSPIRIPLKENSYLHFADDEIEISMIKGFALGYHLKSGRDGICFHTVALSATSQASFSLGSLKLLEPLKRRRPGEGRNWLSPATVLVAGSYFGRYKPFLGTYPWWCLVNSQHNRSFSGLFSVR